MKKLGRLTLSSLPLAVFAVVIFFLWQALHAQPSSSPSAMMGQAMPHFKVANILAPPQTLSDKSFKGQVTALVVWATWCYACSIEHSTLMAVKAKHDFPLYGINYKDTPQKVKSYLAENGNPYQMDGADPTGEITMDFGVQGTPEIFIINKKGRIVYHHVGILRQYTWEQELVPLMERLKQEEA